MYHIICRQVTKIVNGISSMRPDVFGVIEIANDGYGPTSTVADLNNRLNAQLGAGTYAYIDPGMFSCSLLPAKGLNFIYVSDIPKATLQSNAAAQQAQRFGLLYMSWQ